MTPLTADRCAGCYFAEVCKYGIPCEYYTPLADDCLAERELAEYHQKAYEDDYRYYLNQYNDEN